MAVLGHEGKLVLRREFPEPVVLSVATQNTATNAFDLINAGYWSGDQVVVKSELGLPFLDGSNVPQAPDGFATYFGSPWYLGTNRDHITSDSDPFYAQDVDQVYVNTPILTTLTAYIYRDKLDRISFYTDRSSALIGSTLNRLPIGSVDYKAFVLAPATGDASYEAALAACTPEIVTYNYSTQDEVVLSSICDFTTEPLTTPMWQVVSDLRDWELQLDAPNIDTTVVGEKFGEAVKSIVSGGGSLDFLIERRYQTAEYTDTLTLFQLLMLTERGCKAKAQFWMIENRVNNNICGLLDGDLYYEADLLVTNIAINTRASEIIAGSATFVTTGEITLLQGTN